MRHPYRLLPLLGAFALLATGSARAEVADSTEQGFRYTVGGYVDGGLADWAPIVDAVLTEQMDRLTRYVATGSAAAPPS